MSRSSGLRGANLVRLLVLSLIWGASFLFIKVGLEGMTPAQVVFVRVVAGAAVVVGAMAWRRLPLPRSPALWGHMLFLASVANLVPFFLFAWAEERIDSGMAGILNGTTPLLTLVVAMILLPEERASWPRVVGLVVGFAGVVLIVGPGDDELGTGQLSGQLACLAAAACYGVTFTYTRRFVTNRGHPPLVLAACQLGTAAALLLVAAPFIATDPVDLRLPVAASVLTLGAVGTGLAYLLYYALIRDVGATSASMVTYLIPVVAVVLGVMVRGEAVTWNLFVGAGVVILGVAVAEGRLGPGRTTVPEAEIDMPVAAASDDSS